MNSVTQSAPATPATERSQRPGDESQRWKDESLRSIQRAERLVLQSHMNALHSAARYRRTPLCSRFTDSNEASFNLRPKSTGTALYSLGKNDPFPPPALRDQSAEASIGLASEYMRSVREVEGRLRREAGKVNQEATKLQHQRERLEKLLRSVRKALLVNQQSTDWRTFRPTVKGKDGADLMLHHEKKGLNELKQRLETMLRDTLNQQQALSQSSRQLLDCAFERSRVIELLPQHGSPSATMHLSTSPLAMKPDPSGPYTPECKEALESSAAVLQRSQQLRGSVKQLMSDAVVKQTSLHRSVNEGLLKKIAETVNLQHHLTLSSAATKQAIYRKQRQMQCASYSHGRVLGPVSSDDLFCRERPDRPVVQIYGRHPSSHLPESRLLSQGNVTLKQHLESEEKDLEDLQVAHLQLVDDTWAKQATAGVDSSVVRLRRRYVLPMFVQATKT
ncbi:tektin-like protein 1 isoform X2 [Hoplias malabaricus]|uniref:tektin-like protein 1 isoform X2 n=1 Tax=Hoplias malabaricus TaxID=27720 RepID=UPI00346216C0